MWYSRLRAVVTLENHHTPPYPAVSRNMQYKTAELRQRERSHCLVWAFEAVAAIHSEASWSERASSAHPTRRLINAGSAPLLDAGRHVPACGPCGIELAGRYDTKFGRMRSI